MVKNILDVLWSAYYVDRRVKHALQGMLGAADRGLVRLIRRREPKLVPREIIESIRRLDVRIDSPMPVPDEASPTKAPAAKRKPGEGKPRKKVKAKYDANLKDLISAGLLTPPLPLFRKYHGTRLEATLHADGRVEFNGTLYWTLANRTDARLQFAGFS
jgi:hypothetical protein